MKKLIGLLLCVLALPACAQQTVYCPQTLKCTGPTTCTEMPKTFHVFDSEHFIKGNYQLTYIGGPAQCSYSLYPNYARTPRVMIRSPILVPDLSYPGWSPTPIHGSAYCSSQDPQQCPFKFPGQV